MKTNSKVLTLAYGGVIAALYVVLTYLSNAAGLANGAIQVRISEALTILPYFTPAAIPGVFVGCLLSNLLTGCIPVDVICGSLTTLAAAATTYMLGKKKPIGKNSKWLAPVPPIIYNAIVVPFVLAYGYQIEGSIPFFMVTVGAGEVISCGIIGMILFLALEKNASRIFRNS